MDTFHISTDIKTEKQNNLTRHLRGVLLSGLPKRFSVVIVLFQLIILSRLTKCFGIRSKLSLNLQITTALECAASYLSVSIELKHPLMGHGTKTISFKGKDCNCFSTILLVKNI